MSNGPQYRGVVEEDDDEILGGGDVEELEVLPSQSKGKNSNRITVFVRNNQTKMIWLAVGCMLLFFLLVLLLWGSYYWWGGQTDAHMWQLEHSVSSLSRRAVGSGYGAASSLYALGGLVGARTEFRLALCHRARYRATGAGDAVALVASDGAARVRAFLDKRAPQEKNYLVQARLELRYNVALPPGAAGEDKTSEADQLYQTLHYELASNYAQFSSVRLLVTSEDVYKRVLRLRQDVVICSDAPQARRRCSSATTRDQMLLMNNTLLLPQTEAQPVFNVSSRELVTGDAEKLRALERELSDNRQFHLLFYREASGVRDSDDEYAEYLALVVEPAAC